MKTHTSKKIENLHTLIRRYCIERHGYWLAEYEPLVNSGTERSGYEYSAEAMNIFPRYNVLNSILTEIERQRPAGLADLREARDLFCLAVATAEDDFTRINLGKIEEEAKDEERDLLVKYITDLSEETLLVIEPLFFRQVLTTVESEGLWEKLRNRWNLPKGYWFPLSENRPARVEAFQDHYFEAEFSFESVRNILREKNVEHVFELREHGPEYEMELSVFELFYNGAEGFWCDKTFEWVIYVSHEGSITVGGWPLERIKERWSNWHERTWTSPFF